MKASVIAPVNNKSYILLSVDLEVIISSAVKTTTTTTTTKIQLMFERDVESAVRKVHDHD